MWAQGQHNKEVKTVTKKRIRWAILLLTLLLLLGGFILYRTLYKSPELVMTETVEDGQYVKDMNGDSIKKYLQEKADKNYIHLQISPTMIFKKSTEVGHVAIKNSPKNKYSVRVTTFIKGETEKIYDSGLIAPKQYVSEGRLLKKLKSGVYDTESRVKYYDESKKVVGQSNVVGQLSVEN